MSVLRLFFICFSLCLFGCTIQRPNPSSDDLLHSAASVQSWEIKGFISVKSIHSGISANLYWIQKSPNEYQIQLFGPIGSESLLIEKKHSRINLWDGHQMISSSNAEDLFYRQTGFRFPFHHLYYWIRGLPAQDPLENEIRNPDSSLKELHQSGYSIYYNHYIVKHGIRLPSIIHLQSQDLMIKLTIKSWKL